MKFCTNCGEKLEDLSVPCPNCGHSNEGIAQNSDTVAETVTDNVDPVSAMNDTFSSDENVAEDVITVSNVNDVNSKSESAAENAAEQVSGNVPGENISSENSVAGNSVSMAAGLAGSSILSENTQTNQSSDTENSSILSAPDQKKSNGKNKGLIAAVIALLVIGIGGFAISKLGLLGSPAVKFLKHNIAFFEEKVKPFADSYMFKDSQKISTDITVTASSPQMDAYLKDSSIVLKLDGDQKSAVMNIDANFKGTNILSSTITADENTFGFYVPAADENYYVMNLAKFQKLATGQDSENVKMSDMTVTKEEYEIFLKKLVPILEPTFTNQNLSVEKNEVTLSHSKSSFKGDVYTFKPTEDDMKKLTQRFMDKLKNDDEFRKITVKFAVIGSARSGYMTSFEEYEKELLETIIPDAEENLETSFEGFDFVWKVGVEGDKTKFIEFASNGASFAIETSTEGNKISDAITSGPAEGERFTMAVNEYEVNGQNYKGTFSVGKVYIGEQFSIDYDWDLSKKFMFIPFGKTTVKSENYNGSVEADIEVSDGANDSIDHKFSAKTGSEDLTINFNTTKSGTAKKPDVSPTDISDYDEAQLQELFQKIGTSVTGGFQNILFGAVQ